MATVEELIACLPAMKRVAMQLTRNRADADDLVQDAIERCLRKLHLCTSPGVGGIRGWACTVMRRVYFAQCRGAHRFAHSDIEDAPDQDMCFEVGFESYTDLMQALHCIDQMPKPKGDLLLHCAIGTPWPDMAVELGLSRGALKSRIARARVEVRETDYVEVQPRCQS